MINCFYHSSDLDGQCSGSIVKKYYGECILHKFNYDQEIPDHIYCSDDKIIFVDITPIKQIEQLEKMLNDKLIIIDHHISAINELEKLNLSKIKGLRKVGFAGCELTWEYFYPDQTMPECVNLLGRHDVWDHKNPKVLPFQYGIRLNNNDPENTDIWECYFNNHNSIIEKLIENGEIIIKYQEEQNSRYANSCAIEIDFHGYKAIVINQLLNNSQLFNSVWDESKYDIMISFGLRKNKQWSMSFYTTKDGVDCSKLAKIFGGGGHVQAAGCMVKQLPHELNFSNI